ncbi:MAG TPA: hypothetical protein VMU53_07910 [Candidatus Sulfotelmatobacter sp.]|nr:hypothetical protein [Candidatus Sulfotelmatobacter sp.]
MLQFPIVRAWPDSLGLGQTQVMTYGLGTILVEQTVAAIAALCAACGVTIRQG